MVSAMSASKGARPQRRVCGLQKYGSVSNCVVVTGKAAHPSAMTLEMDNAMRTITMETVKISTILTAVGLSSHV